MTRQAGLLLLFVLGLYITPPGLTRVQSLTAGEVIKRIRSHMGVETRDETVDTFKSGDENVPVTGIAVTMMATLDVLQRAAANGHNLIITHEPTYFGHSDDTAAFAEENDPVFRAKKAFIQNNGLVIWRSHDSWHDREPDGIRVGMAKALGWHGQEDPENPAIFQIGPTTLHDLSVDIEDQLDIATMRVVGKPELEINRVGLVPGFGGFPHHRALLARPDVDAVVIGEAFEWETVEYTADAVTAGLPKGLIVLGHIPSEQSGMAEFAEWLSTFVTEIPIELVEAREPFWKP